MFRYRLVDQRVPAMCLGYVENLSQIWAVAPALAKLALRDDRRSHLNKEPPWKRITEGLPSAT